jgi:hypothetical protein
LPLTLQKNLGSLQILVSYLHPDSSRRPHSPWIELRDILILHKRAYTAGMELEMQELRFIRPKEVRDCFHCALADLKQMALDFSFESIFQRPERHMSGAAQRDGP